MQQFRSRWWSLDFPDDWSLEEDETCVSFFSETSVGALQISAARNTSAPVTDDDLKDFAKEHFDAGAPIESLTCGAFTGFYLQYSVDDIYQRQWWLRCDDKLVFVTYTCNIKDKGKEDAVVDNILQTLNRRD